jgi:PKD repeat protein
MKRFPALLLLASVVVITGCTQVAGPVAVISVDRRQGYPPLEITFDGTGSQGISSSIMQYRWDFPDGATAETASAVHTFEQKGSYDVLLTVIDSDGRIGATSSTIHVLNRVPHAEFRISPFGAPRDYPVQFDASGSYDPDGGIVTCNWDFGDGDSAEGMHVEHIFPRQQTEYLVTLTVMDEDGAANSALRTVIVLGCDTCG